MTQASKKLACFSRSSKMERPPPPVTALAALQRFFLPSTPSPLFSPSLQDKRRRYSMLHSQGSSSSSSVFYHSQDEGPSPDSRNCAKSVGAHFHLRQPKDVQPSTGDATTNPGLSATPRASLSLPGRPWLLHFTEHLLCAEPSIQTISLKS